MQHSMKNRHEEGFTLVELLVVIGIIAILTAIAVPMFLSQRQKANVAALRSDMKNVVSAMETWYVDNPNGVIPEDPTRETWSLILAGEGGIFLTGRILPSDPSKIPSDFDVPQLSKGAAIGITARGIVRYEGGPGTYCMVGTMKDSEFSVPDETPSGGDYKFALFYDSRAGGMHTAKDLPSGGSCNAYYNAINP